MEFSTKSVYIGKKLEEEIEVKEQPQTLKHIQQASANVQNRLENPETCLLDILDTAGQEGYFERNAFVYIFIVNPLFSNKEYSCMRDQYYRAGQGFVLMYSIASRSSFDEIKVIYEQLMRVKDCPPGEIPVVLVGNKADLSDERQVTMGEAQEFANSIGAP